MIGGEHWLLRAMKPSSPIPFFACWLNRACAKKWDAMLGSLWKRISASNECAIAIRNSTKRCSRTRPREYRLYDSDRQPQLTQKTKGRDCGAQLALRGRPSCTGRIVDEIVAGRS